MWRASFKNFFLPIFTGLIYSVLPAQVSAADASPVWVVTLNKGGILTGTKVSENKRVIVIDVNGETTSVFRNEIISIDSSGSGMAPKPSVPDLPSPLRQTTAGQSNVPPEPQKGSVNVIPATPVSSGGSPKSAKLPPAPVTLTSTNQDSAPIAVNDRQGTAMTKTAGSPLQIVSFEKTVSSAPVSPAPSTAEPLPRPKPRFNVVSMSATDRDEPSTASQSNAASSAGSVQSTAIATPPVVVPSTGSSTVKNSGVVEPLTVIPAPKFGFVVAKENRAKEMTPTEAVVDKKAAGIAGDTASPAVQTPGMVISAPLIHHPIPGEMSPTSLPPPQAAVIRQVEPLVLVKPPPLLRTSVARDLSGTASVAPSNSPPPRSPLPIIPQPATQVKRKRSDGQQELLLVDGTVFVGTTVSQTERAFVFSSEGALITILKHLVRSIDGELFSQQPSGMDFSKSSTYAAPVAEINRQSKKRVPVSTMFRILPVVELPQGCSVALFVDSMQKSTDPNSRSRVARYCGAMGPWAVSTVQTLAQLLSDTARGQEIIPLIIDSTVVDKLLPPGLEAARALSQLGTQGEAELVKAISGTSLPVRIRAVFGLGTCFLESAEIVVRAALKDPEPALRMTALGSLRATSALLPLLAALSDADPTVRAAAVTLLGRLHDRSAARQISAMAKDNHQAVRRSVAEALATCGGADASSVLLALCRDYDISVRAEAVRTLGKIKDGAAMPAIMEAFKDPAPEVRAGAVEALGFIRDSRAIPTLYAAIKDENSLVRKKAQTALRQLTELPLLIDALDDESPLVQTNAAYVLWLMTGQDLGADKTRWNAWLIQKNTDSTKQK